MAIKFAAAVRNARLDAIETTIGASPVLKIWSGSAPATFASTSTGSVLATLTLPSDWLANASAGAKTISTGAWSDASADNTGTAGHFRIYTSTGTAPQIQGTITGSTGGGDMILDNISISSGQTVTITAFTLTDGNASS